MSTIVKLSQVAQYNQIEVKSELNKNMVSMSYNYVGNSATVCMLHISSVLYVTPVHRSKPESETFIAAQWPLEGSVRRINWDETAARHSPTSVMVN